MSYGIANRSGRPSYAVASGIVNAAYDAGVRCFDTARRYGDAESVLGAVFRDLGIADSVQIVTKLACDLRSPGGVARDIELSLERLGVDRLSALLLHEEEALDWWHEGVGSELVAAKSDGRIAQVGVSVYSVSRALQALSMAEIDCIQVPSNVFDRRMYRAGVFDLGRKAGKTVFIRSVYLQGLALADGNGLNVPGAREACIAYSAFCRKHGLAPAQFAIDYVLRHAPASLLVIGAETVEQLAGTLDALSAGGVSPGLHGEWDDIWPQDHEQLVDPRRWQNGH
jgi:aryl-alcohol dehydrogenase-like predicted oxidoreductase